MATAQADAAAVTRINQLTERMPTAARNVGGVSMYANAIRSGLSG
jgi:hypothetical protein